MKVNPVIMLVGVSLFAMKTSLAIERPPRQDNIIWNYKEFRTILPQPFGVCELIIAERNGKAWIEAKVLGKVIPLESNLFSNLREISSPEITFNHSDKGHRNSVSLYFELGAPKKIDLGESSYSNEDWGRDILEFRIDTNGQVKSKLFKVDELSGK